MSVDAQCIMDFLPNLPLIWSTPLRVMAAIAFLYYTLGISIFAGVGVMVAMIPLNICVGSLSRMLQVKTMLYKDSRIKIVNEVLNGIKVCTVFSQTYIQRMHLQQYYGNVAFLRYSTGDQALHLGDSIPAHHLWHSTR